MADAPHSNTWRATVRTRLAIIAAIFALWGASVQARLAYLQLYRHDHYVARADLQWKRMVVLSALRGSIYDREGRVIATSADVDSVFAAPSEIDDPKQVAAKLCAILEECRGSKEQLAQLEERLSKKRAFAWVKRHASPEEARAIDALDLDGVGMQKESRRFYPMRELLAPVLGYVGIDNRGLGGIELRFNDTIRGKDGKALIYTDARRRVFGRVDKPPTAGASLELTIDTSLQYAVERELARGVAEHRAEGGVAVVMDPWTGDVLAMASWPTFNPNAIADVVNKEHTRNRAIADIYEPGSTFKTVTASAVIGEHVMTPETPIDCAPGYILIGSRRVNDTHRYGVLSFNDVIIKSSNVGAIKAGFRVGAEQLQRYVRRFGFGMRLMRDLPGEEPGIVWGELSDSALASVSMGYQIGVTPLQMVTAVSSIANGGQLMRPRLVRATIENGQRKTFAPEVIRRTVSPETAATLTAIMEGVVDRGTAKTSQIAGYTIAAKTGTSKQLEGGVYAQKYNSSIVGFLPSREPAVAVLVMIDNPRGGAYYGGTVAGPVFKRIAETAIQHLGLPRSIDPEAPVFVQKRDAGNVTPVRFHESVLPPDPAAGRDGVMPDLRGLSARAAIRVLSKAGFTPHVAGTGVVTVQVPVAGEPIEPGSSVRLWLDRAVPASAEPSTEP